MGVRLRDDVFDSFRLVASTEWWVAVDLLAGIAGYVVWVAGSAALGMQVASLAEYQVAPGGTPTLPMLVLAGLLWLVLPAALGVARVRTRLLNIRGNIDQEYRFDRPAALLVPPALLLVVLAGVALAMGTIDPLLFLVLAPVTLYFLVRTIAYSYRVYSFSHPLVVHLGSFLTFLLYATAGVVQLGAVVDQRGMVVDAADILGLPVSVYGTVSAGPITVPTLLTAAAAAPVVVSLAYLLVQSLVATYVVRAEPTVDRAALRAGQRNPFQPTAANGAGGQIRQPAGGSQPASPSSDDDHSVPSHIQPTRVFDPDGEVDNPTGTETSHAGPGDERCRTCGVAFSSGTEIRFCPNCGQRLDDG